MAALRGKVVVIDFWTYSCINCLRTLPHVQGVVRGVPRRRARHRRRPHARVRLRARAGQRRRAVADLGIDYPVALDNDFGTWNAWLNRYWPAKYFIDRRGPRPLRPLRRGRLRGERARDPHAARGGRSWRAGLDGDRRTPRRRARRRPRRTSATARLDRFVGSRHRARPRGDVPDPGVRAAPRRRLRRALDGRGRAHRRRARTRGCASTIARGDVFLVLGHERRARDRGGHARRPPRRAPSAYRGRPLHARAHSPARSREHVLDLGFSPGTEAYAFTFG